MLWYLSCDAPAVHGLKKISLILNASVDCNASRLPIALYLLIIGVCGFKPTVRSSCSWWRESVMADSTKSLADICKMKHHCWIGPIKLKGGSAKLGLRTNLIRWYFHSLLTDGVFGYNDARTPITSILTISEYSGIHCCQLANIVQYVENGASNRYIRPNDTTFTLTLWCIELSTYAEACLLD